MRWHLFVLAFLPALAAAQPAPLHQPVVLTEPLIDKNFYVLSWMERTPEIAKALQGDERLTDLAKTKREALSAAAKSCTAGCPDALRFSDAEIDIVSERLRNIAGPLRVIGPLRESGMYVRYHAKSDPEMLVAAWKDAAHGINRLLDVYGNGLKPRYSEIDSASYDTSSETYRRLLRTVAGVVGERKSATLFFEASLRFAAYLLDINHRDEAARLEPLDAGENQAAIRQISNTEWDRYPYTVIVVPGAGGDRVTWSISPGAKLRAELAANRYHQGKAPFILVSGGYVHPNQTPFAEAIEMKRVLVSDFGVPAAAVLVDPHARHTTTNLRNAARLMYRYGVPFERKALITTDLDQSTYIESQVFTKRCDDELGYQPHKLLGRTTVFDLEFLPLLESLQIDSIDPLDP